MKEDIIIYKNVKSKFASGLLLVFSLSYFLTLAQSPPGLRPRIRIISKILSPAMPVYCQMPRPSILPIAVHVTATKEEETDPQLQD